MHTVIWFQVFQSNINNLLKVIWFQVFLFNTYNLYTIIWFQVFLFNIQTGLLVFDPQMGL